LEKNDFLDLIYKYDKKYIIKSEKVQDITKNMKNMIIQCNFCGTNKEKKRGLMCVDCNKLYMKEYYNKNKVEIYKKQQLNKDFEKHREYNKKYYYKNSIIISEKKKIDRQENPEKYKLLKNNYNKKNPHIVAWRNLLKHTINYYSNKKNDKTEKLLGYNYNTLKEHIDKLLTIGMTWDNYGEWHIDHVKLLPSFNKDTPASIVNDLSNLRPLWATSRKINDVFYEGNLNRKKS